MAREMSTMLLMLLPLLLLLAAITASSENPEANDEAANLVLQNLALQKRVEALEHQLAAAAKDAAPIRRGGGGGQEGVWYENDAQYAFFTGIILCFLIILAVLFEEAQHYLQHKLEHWAHDKQSLVRYYLKLFQRANAEFTVLGFLTFFLWIVGHGSNLYKNVSDTFGGCDWVGACPRGYLEFKDLVKMVDMWLFVAMMLMFMALALVIRTMGHAELAFRCFEEEVMGKADHPDHVGGLPGALDDLHEYKVMRSCFIAEARTRGLDISDDFDFAEYLFRSSSRILDQMCTIPVGCWGTVLVIFLYNALSGILYGLGEQAYWQQLAFCCLLLGTSIFFECFAFAQIGWLAKQQSEEIREMQSVIAARKEERPSVHWELYVIRTYQAITFFLCFCAAKTMENTKSYDTAEAPGNSAVELALHFALTMGICLAHLLWFMPRAVVAITVVLSIPPYVDDVNLEDVRAVHSESLGSLETKDGSLGVPLKRAGAVIRTEAGCSLNSGAGCSLNSGAGCSPNSVAQDGHQQHHNEASLMPPCTYVDCDTDGPYPPGQTSNQKQTELRKQLVDAVLSSFERYDLDGNGSLNTPDEMEMLTINLCYKLNMNVQKSHISEAIRSSSLGLSSDEYIRWFECQFGAQYFE